MTRVWATGRPGEAHAIRDVEGGDSDDLRRQRKADPHHRAAAQLAAVLVGTGVWGK